MQASLAAFLAQLAPQAEEKVEWPGAEIELHVAYYVTDAAPPEEFVTSVRAVVLAGRDVLVSRNVDSVHALPGGRRHPGETLEETLRREIAEETGWAIASPQPLGVVHLHHLGPKPLGYAYLYPDFLWAVFRAEAAAPNHEQRVPDGYELVSWFERAERALELVDLGSRVYVRAALPT